VGRAGWRPSGRRGSSGAGDGFFFVGGPTNGKMALTPRRLVTTKVPTWQVVGDRSERGRRGFFLKRSLGGRYQRGV